MCSGDYKCFGHPREGDAGRMSLLSCGWGMRLPAWHPSPALMVRHGASRLQGVLPLAFSLLSGFAEVCRHDQGDEYSETCRWNIIGIFLFLGSWQGGEKSHFILAVLNGKRLGDQLTKLGSDGISE